VERLVPGGQIGIRSLRFWEGAAVPVIPNGLECVLVERDTRRRRSFHVDRLPWRSDVVESGTYLLLLDGSPEFVGMAEVHAGTLDLDLTVQPCIGISGQVVNEGGTGIAGLCIRGTPGSDAPWAWTVTGGDGTFQLSVPGWVDDLPVAVFRGAVPDGLVATSVLVAATDNRIRIR